MTRYLARTYGMSLLVSAEAAGMADYTSLTEALAHAPAGSTIVLARGHQETVTRRIPLEWGTRVHGSV